MARRPSKRKKPPKEVFQLKEREKIESYVFDKPTLLVLSRMMKKGIFKTLDFPVSMGKEAVVFRATTEYGGFLAVKIYKIETARFFKREIYLDGDPRFSNVKHTDKDIVFAFTRKEFKNLEIAENVGVHSPKPVYSEKNVLVMEFLGERGIPYPAFSQIKRATQSDFKSLISDVKKLYLKGNLVHSDLSEYNLLAGEKPYMIDFAQGVLRSHPRAESFLKRDIQNILRFFSRLGITYDFEDVLSFVRDEKGSFPRPA